MDKVNPIKIATRRRHNMVRFVLSSPILFVWTALCQCSLLVPSSSAFVLSPVGTTGPQRSSGFCCRTKRREETTTRRYLSAEEEQGIEDMRRILESSWNVETMGRIPTDVNDAADSAVDAIQQAVQRANGVPQISNVDLLLPQYDIRQGSNLYDEVLAVEFCIALAHRMKGKSTIIVRDDPTIQTVSRILHAREEREIAASMDSEDDDNDEDTQIVAHKEDDDDGEEEELYDDFADVGLIGSSDETTTSRKPLSFDSSSVESFRESLLQSWSKEEDGDNDAAGKGGNNKDRDPSATTPESSSSPPQAPTMKPYRLASLLGSEEISTGDDMMMDVIRAVTTHAQPNDDEDTIIILSAALPQEMIGVRALVDKYKGFKNIVLVNCPLNPMPRELLTAQTVYSIQPYIARPKRQQPQPQLSQPQPQPPKIVVMRRFPRPWEVFVDIGTGFELACTVPAEKIEKKGPSMQFISMCVKHHLQTKHNSS